MRSFIRIRIAAGDTKGEIKAKLMRNARRLIGTHVVKQLSEELRVRLASPVGQGRGRVSGLMQ